VIAMIKIFVSLLILTSLVAAYPQQEDSVFVIISGDTVHVWNTGAYENCGCLFRMDVILSSDTIYVTEVDTASDWAFCTCYFDLCASVTGLQTGTYFVKLFRYMPLFYPDTVFYIGSTSFTYGGSFIGFSSQTFQSDCYNITEVNNSKSYPKEYTLEQNYPNPFNPNTIIKYSIPELSFVTLKIYDVLGNEIEILVNEEKPAGTYEVEFNSHSGEVRNLSTARQGLPSGIYFYIIKAGEFVETKKMLLLK
jgi:hypothetical protein